MREGLGNLCSDADAVLGHGGEESAECQREAASLLVKLHFHPHVFKVVTEEISSSLEGWLGTRDRVSSVIWDSLELLILHLTRMPLK